MSETIPAEVPIQELIRRVPRDLRHVIEDGFSATSIPVGIHCHNAADRIATLERELAEAKSQVAFLQTNNDATVDDSQLIALSRERDALRARLNDLVNIADALNEKVEWLKSKHDEDADAIQAILVKWKADADRTISS